MGLFDEMAGIEGAFRLVRRPLAILDEMLNKSTSAAYSAYGKKPKAASPSPNTRYRETPKPKFGSGKLGAGYKKQDDDEPASPQQDVQTRTE